MKKNLNKSYAFLSELCARRETSLPYGIILYLRPIEHEACNDIFIFLFLFPE